MTDSTAVEAALGRISAMPEQSCALRQSIEKQLAWERQQRADPSSETSSDHDKWDDEYNDEMRADRAETRRKNLSALAGLIVGVAGFTAAIITLLSATIRGWSGS